MKSGFFDRILEKNIRKIKKGKKLVRRKVVHVLRGFDDLNGSRFIRFFTQLISTWGFHKNKRI
ncbi:MAG: hypothetical protein ACI8RD_001805 [Bacillariaceae sp.]|jgi:hypothetical protein